MNVLADNPYQRIIHEMDALFVDDKLDISLPKEYLDSQIMDISCTTSQFFYIARFPSCNISYLSPSFPKLFGYDFINLSLKSMIKLVHPDDQTQVSLSYKNACEFILNNYDSLSEGSNITTVCFRLKHKEKNDYVKISSTNILHEKSACNKEFKLLSFCTIIGVIGDEKNRISERREGERLCYPFTPRELQILKLMAHGKSSYEIGVKLEISKHTVDTHRRKMLSKSNFCNTAELIAYSVSHGLID